MTANELFSMLESAVNEGRTMDYRRLVVAFVLLTDYADRESCRQIPTNRGRVFSVIRAASV